MYLNVRMSDGPYAELARIAGALASPARLRTLNLLFQGSKTVEALAEQLGESRANTAAHLKVLRTAGLVTAKREGKYAYQAIGDDAVLQLFMSLREAGERLSPAMALLEQAPDEAASSVSPEELEDLVRSRRAVLLDLRPEPEYTRGHLPGARSIPFASLPERAHELPNKRRILAYCRGKYCPNARRGVAVLREQGLRAERLRFGVPEWRAAGLALEGATQ